MTTTTKAQIQAELEALRLAFDQYKQVARSSYTELLRENRALTEKLAARGKFGVKTVAPRAPREIPEWQQKRKAEMAAAKAAAMKKGGAA